METAKNNMCIKTIKSLIPGRIKHSINLILHTGKKYTCPFCGYNSRDLAPIGIDIPVCIEKKIIGAGLRDGGCYKCNSTDRERLIYIYLRDKLNIFDLAKNIRILHLAPERNISRVLFNLGYENYICGDLFAEGYNYPDYVKNINVLNIPFQDNYFDIIICNHLLEHVPNDIDAMKELYRVLKNDGQAILQVPISNNSEKTFEDFSVTDPKEREIVFGQFDHLRIYGQDYADRLKSVGFKTERVNISKEFISYGVALEEDIFIGKK